MQKIYILLFILVICYQAEAQQSRRKRNEQAAAEKVANNVSDTTNISSSADEVLPDEIFTAVEKMPYYPDGQTEGFQKYLKANLIYPDDAQKEGIQGKVFVTFIVKPDGKLVNPKVLRGLGFGCDEEAIRLIRNAPPWIPGTQNGRKVYVRYTLAITFIH